MQTTLEILKAARELISDPVHWTQGWQARNFQGIGVPAKSGEAVCWCILGALHKTSEQALEAREALRLFLPYGYGLDEFNDRHSHAEVLELFDKAIHEYD